MIEVRQHYEPGALVDSRFSIEKRRPLTLVSSLDKPWKATWLLEFDSSVYIKKSDQHSRQSQYKRRDELERLYPITSTFKIHRLTKETQTKFKLPIGNLFSGKIFIYYKMATSITWQSTLSRRGKFSLDIKILCFLIKERKKKKKNIGIKKIH